MKSKIFLLLLFFLLGYCSEILAQKDLFTKPVRKQISSFELGKRYLKLGNSYREAGEYKLALDYLSKAERKFRNSGKSYWKAATYEYFGYYYRDIGDPKKALEYLEKSSSIFSRIISINKGSSDALKKLIAGIKSGRRGKSDKEAEAEIEKLKKQNSELIDSNNELIKENDELKDHIIALEDELEEYKIKFKHLKQKADNIISSSIENGAVTEPEVLPESNVSQYTVIRDGSEVRMKVEELSDSEKEQVYLQTGYAYKRGNIVVDMYGNRIFLK